MQALYDVAAPAKLNLFLHVTGRRADGYHLLQSLFMLIDWADTLHFELRRDGGISREDLGPALPANDLCLRAAQALQAHTGTPLGVHMGVHKRIPSEAGLGGGSSDAASCLLALNRLWQLGLNLSTLCELGLKLGADVPFFLRGRNAWVEGVGEIITPIELPPERFVVVKPPQGLSTAAVFSHPDLARNTKAATIAGFAADSIALRRKPSPELEASASAHALMWGQNDLQAVAERLCPAISGCLEWLAARGLQGRMTGSGSAVFAPLRNPVGSAAKEAIFADAPGDWQLRECASLCAHPLLGWCHSDSSLVGCASNQPV